MQIEKRRTPRVSVVMGVFNGERYLAESVDSILNQTFEDWELIIVNDGSVDGTADILGRITDGRVRILQNKTNLGHAPSLNIAITTARGEYIARQDADDVSLPDRLARQVLYLDGHLDVALLGSACLVIDQSGVVSGSWRMPTEEIDIRWSLLFQNPFIHSSVMIRRSAVEQVGKYSEDPAIFTANVEDYDLWSRIAQRFQVDNLPEQLVKYRCHPEQVSVLTSVTQYSQRDHIAVRNISSLAGIDVVDLNLSKLIRQFLLSNVADTVDLTEEAVRGVLSFLHLVLNRFYSSYQFPPDEIRSHRRGQFTKWGRRCFSLCVRSNSHRGLACRSALLRQGATLLGRAIL